MKKLYMLLLATFMMYIIPLTVFGQNIRLCNNGSQSDGNQVLWYPDTVDTNKYQNRPTKYYQQQSSLVHFWQPNIEARSLETNN